MSETTFATALDSLGTILQSDPGRDAIHLATYAVIAGERLFPGQHVGIIDGDQMQAFSTAEKLIGIVDPFLAAGVHPGQMFWLVLYPRTITSLRHVWTHPDFDNATVVPLDADKELSRQYLEDFAERLFSYYGKKSDDPDAEEYAEGEGEYGSRLKVLIEGIEYGGAFGADIEYTDDVKPSDELYKHYERYTGKPAPERPQYFHCAC